MSSALGLAGRVGEFGEPDRRDEHPRPAPSPPAAATAASREESERSCVKARTRRPRFTPEERKIVEQLVGRSGGADRRLREADEFRSPSSGTSGRSSCRVTIASDNRRTTLVAERPFSEQACRCTPPRRRGPGPQFSARAFGRRLGALSGRPRGVPATATRRGLRSPGRLLHRIRRRGSRT